MEGDALMPNARLGEIGHELLWFLTEVDGGWPADAFESRARILESLAWDGKKVELAHEPITVDGDVLVQCPACVWLKQPKGYVRPEFRKPPEECP